MLRICLGRHICLIRCLMQTYTLLYEQLEYLSLVSKLYFFHGNWYTLFAILIPFLFSCIHSMSKCGNCKQYHDEYWFISCNSFTTPITVTAVALPLLESGTAELASNTNILKSDIDFYSLVIPTTEAYEILPSKQEIEFIHNIFLFFFCSEFSTICHS